MSRTEASGTQPSSQDAAAPTISEYSEDALVSDGVEFCFEEVRAEKYFRKIRERQEWEWREKSKNPAFPETGSDPFLPETGSDPFLVLSLQFSCSYGSCCRRSRRCRCCRACCSRSTRACRPVEDLPAQRCRSPWRRSAGCLSLCLLRFYSFLCLSHRVTFDPGNLVMFPPPGLCCPLHLLLLLLFLSFPSLRWSGASLRPQPDPGGCRYRFWF